MNNLAKRLTEFQWRYGDWYDITDRHNNKTELGEYIEESLREGKYNEILADLAEHMKEEDYEEANRAMELWNALRAFIAKGE